MSERADRQAVWGRIQGIETRLAAMETRTERDLQMLAQALARCEDRVAALEADLAKAGVRYQRVR